MQHRYTHLSQQLSQVDETSHDSGDEEEDEQSKLGVEVVVLQTSHSWGPKLVRRSAAGDIAQAGDTRSQLQRTPSLPKPLPAAAAAKDEPGLQWLTLVVMASLLWILASSGAILVNKHIMVDLHFPYPSTVGSIGLVGTSIVSVAAVKLFRLVPAQQHVSLKFFMTQIMPTGLFLALSMQLGNTAYLHLSVAFVQMLKAFTPVSTMLFAFLFKLENPSLRLIAAVGLITLGVAAASYGEGNFSIVGVAAMVTSMVCEGLRLVMMQFLVAKRSFHPLEALMYLAPAASFWMLLVAGFTEALHIHQDQHLPHLLQHPMHIAASAVAGFGVNAMAMAVITLSSALTLKVLGICKDVGLVLFGVVVLGEHVTRMQTMGYLVSLVGSGWYNAIKAVGTAAAANTGGGGAGAGQPRRGSMVGCTAVVHADGSAKPAKSGSDAGGFKGFWYRVR